MRFTIPAAHSFVKNEERSAPINPNIEKITTTTLAQFRPFHNPFPIKKESTAKIINKIPKAIAIPVIVELDSGFPKNSLNTGPRKLPPIIKANPRSNKIAAEM